MEAGPSPLCLRKARGHRNPGQVPLLPLQVTIEHLLGAKVELAGGEAAVARAEGPEQAGMDGKHRDTSAESQPHPDRLRCCSKRGQSQATLTPPRWGLSCGRDTRLGACVISAGRLGAVSVLTECVVSLCLAGPVTCAALGPWAPTPTPHMAGHLSGLCLGLRRSSPSSLGWVFLSSETKLPPKVGEILMPSLAHPSQGSMLSKLSLEQGGSLECEGLWLLVSLSLRGSGGLFRRELHPPGPGFLSPVS